MLLNIITLLSKSNLKGCVCVCFSGVLVAFVLVWISLLVSPGEPYWSVYIWGLSPEPHSVGGKRTVTVAAAANHARYGNTYNMKWSLPACHPWPECKKWENGLSIKFNIPEGRCGSEWNEADREGRNQGWVMKRKEEEWRRVVWKGKSEKLEKGLGSWLSA